MLDRFLNAEPFWQFWTLLGAVFVGVAIMMTVREEIREGVMLEWLRTRVFGPRRIGREDLEAFWLFVGIAVFIGILIGLTCAGWWQLALVTFLLVGGATALYVLFESLRTMMNEPSKPKPKPERWDRL